MWECERYIAPEIVDGWAYDEKVDLFSLGVVVFELWHPFSTAMERALRLRDLRENGQLPDSFQANHPTITHLIRWLMSSNPHDRPSAREVLASGLLPPRVQDEQTLPLACWMGCFVLEPARQQSSDP
ncbi:uncharacterized protein HaLaN_21948 [Haematococcus lacustris]|uniref:Protein kinase domain-containing protein n=1 Tax=Haematococcus lacustris TaxID=44745 RepID=A0A6A0A3A2_HAELA|nr:uncharacterized protein HaLaN_21948 [Haematococcus lacustris]